MGLVTLRTFAVLHGVACAVFLHGYLGSADLAALPLAPALEARTAVLAIATLLALAAFGTGALVHVAAHRRVARAGLLAAAAVAGLQLAFLVLDRPLFRLTRLHLSRRIFDVLLQPDALRGIGLDGDTVRRALGLVIAALAFTCVLAWAATRLQRPRLVRHAVIAALTLTACDRAAYAFLAPAFFTESNDPAVVLPLASLVSPRLPEDTIEAFGFRAFYRRRAQEHLEPGTPPSRFRYPDPAALAWAPASAKRPDILLLAIESWRADQLDPQTTPNLHALAQKSCVAAKHYASANWTHLSLFSLLTAMSPRAWVALSEQRRAPFSYEVLRRAGYRLSLTSSQEPTWFGLQHTVLPRELALGRYTDDEAAVNDLRALLERPHDQPLFAFLFLNGTHFPYLVPPGAEHFVPQVPEFVLTDPALQQQRPAVFNRYKNALRHVDALVGRLLEAVGPDTIVAVTADHGESFWEDGRFTHTSLLSRVQLHVPFVVHVPGRPPCRFDALTTHPDVLPTLLAAAGVDLDPVTWSDGVPADSAPPDRVVLSLQFDVDEPSDYALIDGAALVRFTLAGGRVRPRDAEWLDGRVAPPPDADDPARWARLLAELRRVTRWWPH